MTKLLRNDPNFAGSINDLRYPHNTDEQFVVDSAKALATGLELGRLCGDRHAEMQVLFENRLHQLMRFRPHNIDDHAF